MNVLAVGAHFDDVELGCSGTLIKHVNQGNRVIIMVVTNSQFEDKDGCVVRAKETALAEGTKSAELIGAELICLDYDTLYVPFDEGLTKQIIKTIEENDIDIVYSHWIHDIHRDHQNTGEATMMAARHVPCFLMYRSNYYDTNQVFRGHFYSDISDVMDQKLEVIKAHKSELERVRYQWMEFFTKQNANDGQRIGVKYAESFEIIRYLI